MIQIKKIPSWAFNAGVSAKILLRISIKNLFCVETCHFLFSYFFLFIFLLLHLIHLTGTWHFVETPINTGDFLNCRVSVIRSQYSRLQALNTLLPFILIKKNGFPKKHKAAFSAKSNYLLIGEVSAKPNSLLYNSNVVTDYSTTLLIKVS